MLRAAVLSMTGLWDLSGWPPNFGGFAHDGVNGGANDGANGFWALGPALAPPMGISSGATMAAAARGMSQVTGPVSALSGDCSGFGGVMATAADEMSPQQRAAAVAWELARGRCLRTKEVMQLTGMSRSGALALMAHLEAAGGLPIRYSEDDQHWQALRLDEARQGSDGQLGLFNGGKPQAG